MLRLSEGKEKACFSFAERKQYRGIIAAKLQKKLDIYQIILKFSQKTTAT
jgi:hypothetical protein